ncbi:hypothetical protein GCM10023156_15830 [Novipirellula rosea]|uniref:Uncharacterized protein n=1 Tax=Novipirellula rosea TaxID=1031540 RepID=A0ABP8MGE1_9BACT
MFSVVCKVTDGLSVAIVRTEPCNTYRSDWAEQWSNTVFAVPNRYKPHDAQGGPQPLQSRLIVGDTAVSLQKKNILTVGAKRRRLER